MTESTSELLKAHEGLEHEVYLDIENSSRVPQEVVEAMLPYFHHRAYGNPTLTHKPGWEALEVIMDCSGKIADFLGCETREEVQFTPGGTEANNLALMGTAYSMKDEGKKVVISEAAPLNVLHVADALQRYGFNTVKIPVDREGFIDLEELREAVDEDTIVVSLSMVNHEIGTIQPVREAVEIVEDRNPETIFHTDASDAYGKMRFDVQELNVDLATLTSYKILGPRGIGGLYVKEGVKIERILEGQLGTQKLWPGVENTPLIVGFTQASELRFHNFEDNIRHMQKLRDQLMEGIVDTVSDVKVNGPQNHKRVADNVNISFLRCEGEALTIELSLNGVYVSSGSACTRRLLQPSHVLQAIGREYGEAHGSILMKVTPRHTQQDVDHVLQVIPPAVKRIRGVTGSIQV